MKIIDLLNKIVNGEEVPKKIRIAGWCYKFEWREHLDNYYDENADLDLMSCLSMNEDELNREVEIIEEETKPLTKESFEALGYALGSIQKCINNGYDKALKNKPFIDEDNEIIPLDIHQEKNCKNNWKWKCNGYNISTPQKIIGEKLNEVIIKLNKMEDNK